MISSEDRNIGFVILGTEPSKISNIQGQLELRCKFRKKLKNNILCLGSISSYSSNIEWYFSVILVL